MVSHNHFSKIVSQIGKPKISYDPLVEVLIFADNLIYNLNQYRKTYPTQKIAPVLKSNAYGHGLVEVAKILDQKSCEFLCVDSFYEALVLRQDKIKSKILILGYSSLEQLNQKVLGDISYMITSLDQLRLISAELKFNQNFHLKIDTGMCRQGILPDQLVEAINLIRANGKITIEGICSHLSDTEDRDFSTQQIDTWRNVLNLIKSAGYRAKYYHVSSSGGVKYNQAAHTNMSRIGIGLYGMDQETTNLSLRPVLRMTTKITGLKNIKKGSKIGYGGSATAKNDIKIATIAAGYFEGVDLRLSNRGYVKIQDEFCPILGRVSMNITTIDVSEIDGINIETPAILISEIERDPNSVYSISRACDTISFEILVHISQHLRRNVVWGK